MRYIYLHGFASGPSSSKAKWFRDRIREDFDSELEIPNLVPGEFSRMTLSGKIAEVENVVGRSPADAEPLTLIGSSMGGYVGTLYTAHHPERVAKLILLAPAFGFPTRWLEAHPEEAVNAWRDSGFHTVYHHEYDREEQIGYQLVTDAQQYPDYPKISPEIPILILHGRQDETVPIAYAEDFLKHNPHARMVAFDADHRLEETDVLEEMWRGVRSFVTESNASRATSTV